MIVRLPRLPIELDHRRLATLLTAALLSHAVDDAPEAQGSRAGVAWLRWGDANCRDRAHLN
jgi:hypothetical protein